MATALLGSFRAWFWNDAFWLPPGVGWADISPELPENYPDFNEMYLPIAYAFIFIIIRIGFEWLIARPIGKLAGLPDPGSELPNIFKRTYRRIRKFFNIQGPDSPQKIANGPASVGRRRLRTVSTSGRFRPIVIPKSTLDKFCESAWRFAFYTFAFFYGLWALWDKCWFSDQAHFFIGYPFHPVDPEIKFYYKMEAGFYWSLMFSQFTDVHRKDFEMMFVHHVATLSLLWFSWAANFLRAGSLIMVIHDAADVWLEFAKMNRYLENQLVCDAAFAIFALTWFVTRCAILPYTVLYTTFVEAPALVVWYPVYFFFNALLMVLQVLHAVWSFMIAKTVYLTIRLGKVEDVRSDDEEEIEVLSEDSE